MNKYLWVESYAPETVADCILPDNVKKSFEQYVEDKEFPNLILAGPAGVGKTSVAKALCNEIDADLLFINASLDRGIGEVRTTVAGFASTSSLLGGKKVILLDEADNLTGDSQKALRALIEEFQNHCRFILTCNYPHNLIDAIHSRCTVFGFHINDDDVRKELSGLFFKRLVGILKENKVKFDMKDLGKFILAKAPDWRGVINTVQGNIKDGKLNNLSHESTEQLAEHIAKKEFKLANEWLFKHSQMQPTQVQRELYMTLRPKLTDNGIVAATLAFGKYATRIHQGADPWITLMALSTKLMVDCEFK